MLPISPAGRAVQRLPDSGQMGESDFLPAKLGLDVRQGERRHRP
jgi:hypothetical protein